ncbi:MAG: peptide MFS transporter [Planctomycetota bacterium]
MTQSDLSEANQQTPTGHPSGLYMLFFAEMWERFCFYGMRSLLTLYMVSEVFKYTDGEAADVYGSYNSLIYLTPILGGVIADRILGFRWTILIGGLFMAVGQFTMTVQQELFFFTGMAFMVIGNGMFKPNISTLVGKLYKEGDPRRDSGFTIFYIGINMGAFLSTLICGYFAETGDWTIGFGIAGVGMLLGLFTFGIGKHRLQGHGEPPNPQTFARNTGLIVLCGLALIPVVYTLLSQNQIVEYVLEAAVVIVLGSLLLTAFKSEKTAREKLFVLLILWVFHSMFWMFFEQAGTSLTLFAARNIDRETVFGTFPAAWGQFFNPFFILTFGSLFTWLWLRLGRMGRDPSIPTKFGLGLLQLGAGFGVLVIGAGMVGDTGLVYLPILVLCYLLHTTGELCLSPVGLSAVTKLAPKHLTGMVMGAWFLSISVGQFVAARIAGTTGEAGGDDLTAPQTLPIYTEVFEQITMYAVGAGLLLIVMGRLFLQRWLHGVK